MKTQILTILSLLLVFGQLSAKEIVVEYPAFSTRLNDAFDIEKIIITENSTTVQIRAHDRVMQYVDCAIYLNVGGKEYPIQYYAKHDSGTYENNVKTNYGFDLVPFSLVFPPIPAKTERFDLCTRNGKLMIWGIELKKPKKNTKPSTAHIPDEFLKVAITKEDGKGLEAPQWKAADAILKGYFAGYKPEMNFRIELSPNNIVTGRTAIYIADVNRDGTFEIDVPILVTRQVWFRVFIGNADENVRDFRMRGMISPVGNIFTTGIIVLSPGEETRICFDMPAYFRREARLRYDKQIEPKIFYFAGANAEINNLYHDAKYHTYSAKIQNSIHDIRINDEIAKLTPSEFKERVIKAKEQCIAEIDAHPSLTLKTKEFFKLNLEYYAADCLDDIKFSIRLARLREDSRQDTEIELNKEYYSYLNDLPLNSPVSLYFLDYNSKIVRGKFIEINNEQTPLSEVTGISEGLFFDLIECREICAPLGLKPLPEENIERLKQLKKPFFEQIILAENEEILAKIENKKSRRDYHVNDVQDKENDELFEAIIGKEKGKVVLVDFWANGVPFHPFVAHKDKFDPDKVVFVYLTDEKTTIDKWNLIIPDFSGEHYRLSRKQYEYMVKRFKLDMHTSLVLLDKNSDRITFSDGLFFSVKGILDKINEALTK